MNLVKVKVVLSGTDGEVIESFIVEGLAEDYPRDTVLAVKVRELIERHYETIDE